MPKLLWIGTILISVGLCCIAINLGISFFQNNTVSQNLSSDQQVNFFGQIVGAVVLSISIVVAGYFSYKQINSLREQIALQKMESDYTKKIYQYEKMEEVYATIHSWRGINENYSWNKLGRIRITKLTGEKLLKTYQEGIIQEYADKISQIDIEARRIQILINVHFDDPIVTVQYNN